MKSILKKTSNEYASTTSAKSESLFPSSKKDKRRIKHAQLVHKVTKSAERKPKRRRPNKKLVTTLDALADALPDGETTNGAGTGDRPQDQVNIIKRKSMKSRPGAMKRRENLDRGERDRFAKNMAQLAAPKSVSAPTKEPIQQDGSHLATKSPAIPSTSERWAALRGFISQTLETKPELTKVKS